jgi:hypothetical protein
LDGADFIVQGHLRNMGSAFTAEIVAPKIRVLKEADSAPGPAPGTPPATGAPPAGSAARRLDAELSFAAAIDPDASPVVAPSLTTNALLATELLNQYHNGTRVAYGAVLEAMTT